ncbi:unnamed protein product [Callosobruchus maculatus]|uniref:Uncharacterized protein n=1 Tax=Callosobruchus maculatus TaxID=64391 RepID=A0A653BK78_CALMS|nr:unnamed protein product [Callosobruchus maculatus]
MIHLIQHLLLKLYQLRKTNQLKSIFLTLTPEYKNLN